ncbi:MAG TPA: hypothetical protein VGQ17_18470, partial [Gemmatimonadales bacterium]|nr:hypothetical protein [Gemmatimonadales bacterium]
MIETILSAFERTPFAQDLSGRLPPAGAALRLGGLAGSSGAAMVAWLAERLPQRLFTVVAATPAEAERWLADLGTVTELSAALYPQREGLGEEEPHYEIAGERAETLEALLRGQLRILVTTARATAEKTLVPEALERMRLELAVGMERPLTFVVAELERMGYRRVPVVTEVAEFAVRGGIVDVYGFGMAHPARLEWWGDEISSIRAFDLTTQRSGEALQRVTILPIGVGTTQGRQDATTQGGGGEGTLRPGVVASLRRTLLDLLPTDTLLVEEASHPNAEEVSRAWREAEHHLEIARRLGEAPPAREDLFAEPAEWEARIEKFPRLRLREERPDLQAGFLPPEAVDRNLGRLRGLLAGGPPTLILCDNQGQLERLDELLQEGEPAGAAATLVVGALDGGFVMPTLRVLTDHEIFRRARRLRRPRRYRQAA